MTKDLKAIAQLKKKYSKWPSDRKRFGIKELALNYLPASFVFLILSRFVVKTDYKLKRESIKFFLLANRAYGAKKTRKCDRLLRIAFKLLGSEFPRDYAELVSDATKFTLKDASKRRGLSESILQATKQLEPLIFDATGWYQLSRGLFSLGYFRAAWVARENSLDRSIVEGSNSGATANDIERGIQAHLEQGNLDDVRKILSLYKLKIKLATAAQIEHYLAVIQGNFASLRKGEYYSSKISSIVIRNLINEKTVALVGSGVPAGAYGEEIDRLNTVVRIKYIDKSMIGDETLHGSRTDITFLGHLEPIKILSDNQNFTFGEIKLIISSRTRFDFVKSLPVHVIQDEGFLYRSTSVSGIRTLFEILKYTPKSLKIFGFDFLTTLTPYSKEVANLEESSSWKLGYPNLFLKDGKYFKFMRAYVFSAHDFVSNFCFAQNLYRAGLFEIEPFGKSILELTPYQYVERLEEMLGDW